MDLTELTGKLQQLLTIGSIYDKSEQVDPFLIDINKRIFEIEADLDQVKKKITEECHKLSISQDLLDALSKQRDALVEMISKIPESDFHRDTATEKSVNSNTERPSAEKPSTIEKASTEKPVNSEKTRQPVAEKTSQVALIDEIEFATIPKYIVGRMQIDKLNQFIQELNILINDKRELLATSHSKLSKNERDLFWQHKEAATPETKGMVFVTENDLRDHKWSKSKFMFNAVGRNVVTILRHLGRIKEVRGGGHVRIILQ